VFEPMLGPRERRRQETIEHVVAAASDLIHEHGLAALSMRDLAARVGLKAPSLYQYFPSKHDIYDALFAKGHRQLQARMDAELDRDGDAVTVFKRGSRIFTEFGVEDPVRYQLLFQRTIPDFVPSEESMALAWASYRGMADALADAGVTDQADLDLWSSIQLGLTEQQLANDPGGRRFIDLLDPAIDMFLTTRTTGRRRPR
jgi:AcrR family transcriptional regulator